MTSKQMKNKVEDFLKFNKSLDLRLVSRFIEENIFALPFFIRNEVDCLEYLTIDPEKRRKKAALLFLSRNGTVDCLKTLKIVEMESRFGKRVCANYYPTVLINKILKNNRNLEELVLINVSFTSKMLELIGELSKLKHLVLKVLNGRPVLFQVREMMQEVRRKYGTDCELNGLSLEE